MTSQELETNADWDFKTAISSLYIICGTAMAVHLVKKTSSTEKVARLALSKLIVLIRKKLHILNDHKSTNYVAYFTKNPDKFHLFELHVIWLIIQEYFEKVGLTKFERVKIPTHNLWKQDGQ